MVQISIRFYDGFFLNMANKELNYAIQRDLYNSDLPLRNLTVKSFNNFYFLLFRDLNLFVMKIMIKGGKGGINMHFTTITK